MRVSEWPEAAQLIEASGIEGEGELIRLKGGANNRVFHVIVGTKESLLKAYYHDPRDARDRLRTEFEVLTFAWQSGIRTVPEPLGLDPQHHLALFEFVHGRHLFQREIDETAVGQAAELFRALNRHRTTAEASRLPNAAEACLSVTEHLELVKGRVKRLSAVAASDDVGRGVELFVSDELLPFFAETAEMLERRAGSSELLGKLNPSDLRLSPSDFGFHNALLKDDGTLHFLDFEYAGWDDPARVICDFFWQPALPVPERLFDHFADVVVKGTQEPMREIARARLLRPLYGLKWCCIVLNDFVPGFARRREFATGAKDEAARANQLAKARAIIKRARELLEECRGP